MEGSVERLLSRFDGALAGEVAIVTGAGSGIGRATSLAFGKAGADVTLIGRRSEALGAVAEELSVVGRRSLVVPLDVRDDEAVRDAVARTAEGLGPVSIAVANAGVNAWADLEDQTPELVREAMGVNVEGVANLIRVAVPPMRERGRGKGSAYVASKFAAVGLSLSIARELFASGVGVHVIEPGCVDTAWYPPEEEAPRTRMLRPDDVAYVALLLATMPSDIVIEEVLMQPRGLLVTPW
jgi:NADP-dependent 3-hydroxy acid dehydrogenase YdfG